MRNVAGRSMDCAEDVRDVKAHRTEKEKKAPTSEEQWLWGGTRRPMSWRRMELKRLGNGRCQGSNHQSAEERHFVLLLSMRRIFTSRWRNGKTGMR